jgi:hypothetical protein
VSGIKNVIVVIMLIYIYIVSFNLQLPSCVTIHNQCPNVKLASPVYFSNGAISPKLFNQQIDIDTAMRACFEIDTINFECVLLFKLKRHIESDKQHNMNTSTTGADKNETMHIYMLVIFEVKDAKPFSYVALVEHTKAFTWSENRLKELYDKNRGWLKKYNGITLVTWCMDDNATLKTSFKERVLEENFELSVSISEEEKSDYAMRPFCIHLER